MQLQTVQLASPRTPCNRCLFDAGFQCGMAGAARCALIEKWEAGEQPEQWLVRTTGSWTCSDYQAGLVLTEH